MKLKTLLLASAILMPLTPALADHPGPTGIDGGGATISLLSPDTLESNGWSAGTRLSFTRPDQRPDEELARLAGKHIHAHNADYVLNSAVGVAYGITDQLTVSAELPYVRRDDLRAGEHSHSGSMSTNEVVELDDVSGIGDASILAKYKIFDRDGLRFALVGGLKLPTGSTRKRSKEGEWLETEHQPGSGSWDPLVGAAIGTKFGPVQLTASGLYQWSGKGAQDTRLGDRAQVGVAISHRFGPPEHHHEEPKDEDDYSPKAEHHGRHGHDCWDVFVELTGEWEGRQKVDGEIEEESGGHSIWFGPGARYNSAKGWSAALAFGLPVWQSIRDSHPDNDYRLTLAVSRAF